MLVFGAMVTYAVIDAHKNQPDVAITAIGVPSAVASCDLPTTDKASGNGKHVDPSQTPKIRYSTVPPSNGSHFPQPDVSGRKFFTAFDRPKMEVLVHNLEHGYTVLWYDPAAGEAKKAELAELAKVANTIGASANKFIVSAWDPSYGKLPAGKRFALSHWSANLSADQRSVTSQAGHRQLCGDLSGQVVLAFVQKFPSTAAPEPRGA